MSSSTQLCDFSWQIPGDTTGFDGWHDCARYEDHEDSHRCSCGNQPTKEQK